MNDKLLQQYVEWIANRRLKAIGLKPQYDIAAANNPLPWTQHWISSKGLQVAPQETEVENYLVGGCLLYTSPSPRDKRQSRMPSSA